VPAAVRRARGNAVAGRVISGRNRCQGADVGRKRSEHACRSCKRRAKPGEADTASAVAPSAQHRVAGWAAALPRIGAGRGGLPKGLIPVGFALKVATCHHDLGALPFVALQLLGVARVFFFPGVATSRPKAIG
jgi:hypothetical protein